jgi:hypothetical protein
VADDDDVFLPSPAERDGLGQELAAVVAQLGVARLLQAPLVDASATWFPDPWGGGTPSVERLVRRLWLYAGLEPRPIRIDVHPEDPDRRGGLGDKPAAATGQDPVAWYAGNREGVLRFGVEEIALREPIVVVPALARAVAHAAADVSGLPLDARGYWDPRVDVVAVVLGFGQLTLDAARRHVARADGGFRATRSVSRLGALPGPSIGWLLAVQLLLRRTTEAQRRPILRAMSPNSAAFVRASLASLASEVAGLGARLRVPEPHDWPPGPDLDALREPFEIPAEELAQERAARRDTDRGARDLNRGKPVFRVQRTMATRLFRVGLMSVFLLGGLAGSSAAGCALDSALTMPLAVGLGVVGLVIGRFIPDARCSEPKCQTSLSKDARVCPTCGGEIVGTITHPRERLAAEEALGTRSYAAPPEPGASEAPRGGGPS